MTDEADPRLRLVEELFDKSRAEIEKALALPREAMVERLKHWDAALFFNEAALVEAMEEARIKELWCQPRSAA